MAENNTAVEHKILIEFISKGTRKISRKVKYWIQNKPYQFGLKITNIDDKGSPEFRIRNLCLLSGEGSPITQENEEEFSVPLLNPGQEIDLWWPEPMAPAIKGASWIQCQIIANDTTKTIITHQINEYSKKPQEYRIPNRWGDALAIRGEMEEEQYKTNRLLLILTILMFLDGIWGLEVIFKIIIEGLSSFFSTIGIWLQKPI